MSTQHGIEVLLPITGQAGGYDLILQVLTLLESTLEAAGHQGMSLADATEWVRRTQDADRCSSATAEARAGGR